MKPVWAVNQCVSAKMSPQIDDEGKCYVNENKKNLSQTSNGGQGRLVSTLRP